MRYRLLDVKHYRRILLVFMECSYGHHDTTPHTNNERYILSPAASFPCGKSPTQTGGKCDPLTYTDILSIYSVVCALDVVNPIVLTGAAALRKEPSNVG
jgi:hypothetical protein